MSQLPEQPEGEVVARVDADKRRATENNHSATHLLHAALREILGNHVEQKGSLVAPDKLRFDFSHFSKLTDEELKQVEDLVNEKIQQNIHKQEDIMSFDSAMQKGAMALFGEKYGDDVRVISFDDEYSVELCGGCHVDSTAQIRLFKILSESASAAGIRRIEAVTGSEAIDYYKHQDRIVNELASMLRVNKDLVHSIEQLISDNETLNAEMQQFHQNHVKKLKGELLKNVIEHDGIQFIGEVISVPGANELKDLIYQLEQELEKAVIILGTEANGKALLSIMISKQLVEEKNLNAGVMIRELAKQIKGGGGGQPFYATAGGSDADGLQTAVEMGRSLVLG